GKGGASAVAAGILHPLTPRLKLIWKGEEGFRDALALIDAAEQYDPLVVSCRRVVRPITTPKQRQLFTEAAKERGQWVETLSQQ
ncbi:unnamed protein product, partial [Chrysoparadoxa australica]